MASYDQLLHIVKKNKKDILIQAREKAATEGLGVIYCFNDEQEMRYCSFSDLRDLGIYINELEYDPDSSFIFLFVDKKTSKVTGPVLIFVDQKKNKTETPHPLLNETKLAMLKKPTFTCANALCWQSGQLYKCGRCFVAVYCSRECQLSDWVRHMYDCKTDRNH
jgi:hypothetical protein